MSIEASVIPVSPPPPTTTNHCNTMSENPVVFFDITIGGSPKGRIEMELRADVVVTYCVLFASAHFDHKVHERTACAMAPWHWAVSHLLSLFTLSDSQKLPR